MFVCPNLLVPPVTFLSDIRTSCGLRKQNISLPSLFSLSLYLCFSSHFHFQYRVLILHLLSFFVIQITHFTFPFLICSFSHFHFHQARRRRGILLVCGFALIFALLPFCPYFTQSFALKHCPCPCHLCCLYSNVNSKCKGKFFLAKHCVK